eukprot:scaffold174769_cov43-Prasinocladus_malaysianus.AAC.2
MLIAAVVSGSVQRHRGGARVLPVCQEPDEFGCGGPPGVSGGGCGRLHGGPDGEGNGRHLRALQALPQLAEAQEGLHGGRGRLVRCGPDRSLVCSEALRRTKMRWNGVEWTEMRGDEMRLS